MPENVGVGLLPRVTTEAVTRPTIFKHRKLILGAVALNVSVILFVAFVGIFNQSTPASPPARESLPVHSSPPARIFPPVQTNPPVKTSTPAPTSPSAHVFPSIEASPPVRTSPPVQATPPAHASHPVKASPPIPTSPVLQTTPSTPSADKFCRSRECNKTAHAFRMSLERGTSPCDDFYRYACGNWNSTLSTKPLASSIEYAHVLHKQDQSQLIKLVDEINSSDIEALQQLKIFYRSCTDIGMGFASDSGLTRHLEKKWISEVLKRVFLPEDSIGRTLARINRELGLPFIFTVGVVVNKETKLENEMIVDKPQPTMDDLLLLLLSQLREMEVTKVLNKFQWLVFIAARRLGITGDPNPKRIVELEKKLVLVMAGSKKSSEPGNFKHFNLRELNELSPKVPDGETLVDWIEYMETLFEGLPDVNITQHFMVNVRNVDFVTRVGKFLATIPLDQIRMSLIVRVLLKLGVDMSPLAALDVEARQKTCIGLMEDAMPFATTYKYILANAKEGKVKQVQEIFDNVRIAFNSTISSLDWMGPTTKSQAMRKVANIKTHIGYPHWLLNSSKVNDYYEGLNFTDASGASFAKNGATFRKWRTEKSLKEFKHPVPPDYLWDAIGSSPVTVNLFNAIERNAIVIPEGFLRFPYFGTGISAINYGALGSSLGHEVAHGFDSDGRKRDETGKLSSWWTITSEDSFMTQAQCFVDQYEGYWTKEMGFNGSRTEPGVKANRTLDEDISDNWGLRAAFEAFRMNRKSGGAQEQTLPELEEYSSEQLFFLSFAHAHCSYNNQSGERSWEKSSHSPNWIRVMGSLSNYGEFSRAWQCPRGSGMNPEKKCDLWG